jgi:DNA-binding beta-propeller fold protein YncE
MQNATVAFFQPRSHPMRGAAQVILLITFLNLSGCGDPTKPEAIWCETGTGPAEVVYPRAITYDSSSDAFYVIDRVAHVQRLDRNGKCLSEWQMPEWRNGKPVGAAVGPDGNLWVPDTHYHRVVVYQPDGKMLQMFGSEGTGDGQFIYPTDIGFDQDRIYVSEYGGNDRIQVFDHHWKKLFQFGRFGNGPGEFSRPQTMIFDRGLIYITDACNHRIVVFTTEGKWVRNMGEPGSNLGQFRFPYGLAEDQEGHLIVCEFGNNRVQMIDKETGRGLKIWGSAGRQPGQLAYPWGVAVDKHDRVVAVDAGNNRLQVFEF